MEISSGKAKVDPPLQVDGLDKRKMYLRLQKEKKRSRLKSAWKTVVDYCTVDITGRYLASSWPHPSGVEKVRVDAIWQKRRMSVVLVGVVVKVTLDKEKWVPAIVAHGRFPERLQAIDEQC